jgi:exonuclease VII large subunit
MSKNGAVVRSTAEVQSGDSVEVRMADGSVAAQIT